jgi:predicted O-methyltransferase YrrM
MTEALWTAVDQYITRMLVPPDAALNAALEASDAADLPAIQVTPNQGKLLHLLVRLQGARRILEIGTLGGYSTIWLARALPPGGHLVTLEANPSYAKLAYANIARAGLSSVVEIRVGRAVDTLPGLAEKGPFDLIFIDADKPSTSNYFQWAVRLARRDSLIIVDNVVREGEIIEASSEDPNVQGMRRFFELASTDPRVSGTAIQTVGSKGHDGLAILLVTADP